MKLDDVPLFRRNLWHRDGVNKLWWTPDVKRAQLFRDFMTPEAAAAIADIEARELSKVVGSYATDTVTEFPVPAGIDPMTGQAFRYLGFQKAGIEYALKPR